ncbi:MAG: LysR family transcriptional regulator ArgP [Actinomycetota bacterium]|jgi:LysR family transcriptional regulator (chromosome initiation inhibitor)|nr:LysR family transcriptional regulator ArgP [Actinomycetota bacterium]
MPAFRTEHLETLVALVEEGTFDAAASRLSVTPSAISQRIKAMEKATGQVLVQRSNPVEPTAAGDIALRYGRQMKLLEDEAARALALEEGEGGAVTVPLAINADSLGTWFMEALARFQPSGVVFEVFREDQEHTTSLLRAGKVMAAVTSTAEAVQGCRSELLGTMTYHPVCSPGFLEKHLEGKATPKRLGQVPVVDFDRKDQTQNRFFREYAGRPLRAPRHYIPTSSDYARAIVLGLGWGLLPDQQCAAELKLGELVEFAPKQAIAVPLYWQRWTLESPLLEGLTEAVKDVAAREMRQR